MMLVPVTDILTAAHGGVSHLVAGGLFPDNPATAPSSQASTSFGQLIGDLKWVGGVAAIVGILVLVIVGVVAHRRQEGMMEHFAGFVKILALLIVMGSAVSVVSTFVA